MQSDGLLSEEFRSAYDKAVAANAVGDIKSAKRYFLQASELMSELADNSAPPLDKLRRERAEKLKYIAENLTEKTAVGKDDLTDCDGEDMRFLHSAKPNEHITFDDIIGLDEAKAAIHRLLIDPLNNPMAYEKYGIKAGGFLLLEGPPGTGKTTFAKAAASELKVPFAEVNANSLVDSYIGKTGKNIDRLFYEARTLAQNSGTPVVLFIDELDYIAQKRGGENKTAAEAVPALIKQMDGFSTGADNIVLIAATNIKNSLDAAILSRFGNIVNIPLPTRSERLAIFKAKLNMLESADLAAADLESAAAKSDGLSGRDITQISLEVKNALAARDAEIRPLSMPLSQLLAELIEKRKAVLRS